VRKWREDSPTDLPVFLENVSGTLAPPAAFDFQAGAAIGFSAFFADITAEFR
jgi:hypothetical protein